MHIEPLSTKYVWIFTFSYYYDSLCVSIETLRSFGIMILWWLLLHEELYFNIHENFVIRSIMMTYANWTTICEICKNTHIFISLLVLCWRFVLKFIVIQGPHFTLQCIVLLLTFAFGSPHFNRFEKCLGPTGRHNGSTLGNRPQLHIRGPTHHDMAHGLRSVTPVCARNWFWPVFSDMMIVCWIEKKPGSAERFWVPNKSITMVLGTVWFVQKLFKNLKSFWKKTLVGTLDRYKLSASACGASTGASNSLRASIQALRSISNEMKMWVFIHLSMKVMKRRKSIETLWLSRAT